VQQHRAALDMAEEAVAEARAFMRALDQAGDVGEDEFLGRVQAHHAELLHATSDATIEAMYVWERYSLIHGVRIAERSSASEAWGACGLYAPTGIQPRPSTCVRLISAPV
jgi:hypothetical protein